MPAKFHELIVTSHETSQCICPSTAKIYTWKMSLFYSVTFPKAVNDKSDIKMEDLTSRANIHRKQAYMCMSKKITHMHVHAHVHIQ